MAGRVAISLVFIISIFSCAYFPGQEEFGLLLSLYSCAFGSYILLLYKQKPLGFKFLTLTFIFAALLLVGIFPQLSDDVYRFYWDGLLTIRGISPYAYLPGDLISDGTVEHQELYEMLNSKEYYSVYPPLNQLFFSVSTLLSSSVYSFSIWLKIIYLAIVLTGLLYSRKLCNKLGVNENRIFLFYLNPLVLIEGIGNLHIEIVVVSFLSIAFYFYHQTKHNNVFSFSFLYSLAVGIKLNPLLISPFLWFHQNTKWKIQLLLSVAVFLFILLFPVVMMAGSEGFISSIDLYFRRFEFNGSIYYVLRYLGQLQVGYNLIGTIGPVLGVVVLISIFLKSIFYSGRDTIDVIKLSLWGWTVYLLCSTTVHPWYIMPLIFYAIYENKKYPIFWSYLITWTYVNYSYPNYFENLWVVGAEYAILGMVILWDYGVIGYRKDRIHLKKNNAQL
jgi:hypothetical protein